MAETVLCVTSFSRRRGDYREWEMVVTDRRTIFVIVLDPKVTRKRLLLGGLAFGAVGAAAVAGIGFLIAVRREIDYVNIDLDGLTRTPGTVSIPHSNLRRIRFDWGPFPAR